MGDSKLIAVFIGMILFLAIIAGIATGALVHNIRDFIALTGWTISVVALTWYYLHLSYYDPKSQIKRLWKVVHTYSALIHNDMPEFINLPWRKGMDKTGMLINALLDYHFPSHEEDDATAEYVKQNKYHGKS